MPYQNSSIERTFSALSDPTRRAVVQALSQGPASVSQLASPFAMALPSFTQHLGVLERSGLIVSRREGRMRVCSLNPAAMREAEDWLAAYRREWEARMDRFEAHLVKAKQEKPHE